MSADSRLRENCKSPRGEGDLPLDGILPEGEKGEPRDRVSERGVGLSKDVAQFLPGDAAYSEDAAAWAQYFDSRVRSFLSLAGPEALLRVTAAAPKGVRPIQPLTTMAAACQGLIVGILTMPPALATLTRPVQPNTMGVRHFDRVARLPRTADHNVKAPAGRTE